MYSFGAMTIIKLAIAWGGAFTVLGFGLGVAYEAWRNRE